MLFRDIPSNTKAKQHLLKSIHNNKISHAQLFLGNDGSSSLAMAWAFSQYLMCENRTLEDSCGKCPSCLKTSKLNHPDLHWVFPVVTGRGANPVSDMFLSDWREFLKGNIFPSEEDWHSHLGLTNRQSFISVNEAIEISKKTILKPYEGSYRIILIWHCEKMLTQTANKLLKLLEEPPQKNMFILITNQSDKLLATIKSRLQCVKIESTDRASISTYLQEKYNVTKEKSEDVANLSEGNIGAAISFLLGNELLERNIHEFQKWMRLCFQAKIIDLVTWVDFINSWGREQQKGFLTYSLHMIRESLIENFASNDIKKVKHEESSFIKKFAPFIHENNSIKIIEELERAHQHISRNGNAKIIFMDLTLRITVLLHIKSINLLSSTN